MIFFSAVIYIAIFYFTFVFTIRRRHDRNHTGELITVDVGASLTCQILMLYLILHRVMIVATAMAHHANRRLEAVLAWIYTPLLSLVF